MNDEWHGESVENTIIHFDESVEMVALEMRRVSVIEDGGCAWMALTEPSIAPLAAAVAAEFATI